MDLCLVVPCFNESKRLTWRPFESFLKSNPGVSLIFVNDGSTDSTEELLNQFSRSSSQVQVLSLSRNQGKAEAVRQGMLHALTGRAPWIGFWDADLATPFSEALEFLKLLEKKTQLQCVTGARILRMGGRIERKWYRHYLSRVSATLISRAMKLPYYDTQCGAKLFKRELAQSIFREPFLSRWLFDVELIFRIKATPAFRSDPSLIYEYPLSEWNDVSGSKVKPWDVILVFWQLRKISRRYGNSA